MSLFASYEDAPYFAPGCDSSAAAIDRIWRNARLIDLISLRGRDAFQAHNDRHEPVSTNPLPHWQGGFLYRIGLTTATFVFVNTKAHNERIRLRFNEAVVADVAVAPGVQTVTVALAGLGYADMLLVEVAVEIYDSALPADLDPHDGWGRYELIDAYVAPLSAVMAAPWGGTPTFTNAYDTAKLNQLANASDWLALRLGLLPMPLFQAITFATGEYWQGANKGLWYGGIARAGGMNRLILNTLYDITSNQQESLRIKINGAVVGTRGPLNAGAKGAYSYDIDLSGYPDATPLRVEWDSLITAEPLVAAPQPSRYSLFEARLAPGSAATFATLPAATDFLESMSWGTLKSRLNTLAAIFAAVKARIDATPDLFDRGRLYRSAYGYNEGQREYFQNRHIPLRMRRVGGVLVVRGKGVTLSWGPGTVKAPKELGGEYEITNAFEETLIAGDTVASKLIYLDTLPGLEVGAAYNLRGSDIRYAAEFLR